MLSTRPVLIAVDWGTTNFRAFLLNGEGCCVDVRKANTGIANADMQHSEILHKQLDDWLTPNPGIPVVLCGMVGSRQGWAETSYISCPFNAQNLARDWVQVSTFNQGKCWIIPGAQCKTSAGYSDVMRGEETQLLGAISLLQEPVNAICMPGTHNKWALIEQGSVTSFRTAMTGEMYHLLSQYSLLSHSVEQSSELNCEVFLAGVELARREPNLLQHLFSVRTNHLLNVYTPAQSSAYLSGLLIGRDVASMLDCGLLSPNARVAIVASETLAKRYEMALLACSFQSLYVPGELAVTRGIFEVAKAANIIHLNPSQQACKGSSCVK